MLSSVTPSPAVPVSTCCLQRPPGCQVPCPGNLRGGAGAAGPGSHLCHQVRRGCVCGGVGMPLGRVHPPWASCTPGGETSWEPRGVAAAPGRPGAQSTPGGPVSGAAPSRATPTARGPRGWPPPPTTRPRGALARKEPLQGPARRPLASAAGRPTPPHAAPPGRLSVGGQRQGRLEALPFKPRAPEAVSRQRRHRKWMQPAAAGGRLRSCLARPAGRRCRGRRRRSDSGWPRAASGLPMGRGGPGR